MNFTYENQGTHTFLVYTVGENDVMDSMSLGMLTNNKIHGLAHTMFMQMDTKKFVKYDVSAKISVKQFFTGQVNKKRLLGVFNGIIDAVLSAEDYMIDANSILLDLEYIFADVSTCETVLICLPVVSDDLSNRDLGAFFKNIMFTTQFDQTENCDHVAKIINYLNSTPAFSLVDFKKLLEDIGGNAAPVQAQHQAAQQPVIQKPQAQQTQPTPQQSAPAQRPVQQPIQQPIQQKPPVQPPVIQQRVQPAPVQAGAAAEKSKGFSLFGFRSSKDKKAQKVQPVPAPAPQHKAPAQAGFAIPGQQAPVNQGFAMPGQPTPVQPAPAQRPVQQPAQQPVQQKAPAQPLQRPAYSQPQMPQGQSMNFGETTVLGGGNVGETTVLGATPAVQAKPHLIRAKNNEKIDLNKPVFRIGKEKSYVDYFIGDNSAISRSHANVITRDGEYFVVDTNSTNHTYVNGQMIQSNVETKIAHGAKIRLGNEDFEFKLY